MSDQTEGGGLQPPNPPPSSANANQCDIFFWFGIFGGTGWGWYLNGMKHKIMSTFYTVTKKVNLVPSDS